MLCPFCFGSSHLLLTQLDSYFSHSYLLLTYFMFSQGREREHPLAIHPLSSFSSIDKEALVK